MTYEINLEAEVRFACKGDTQWAFLAKKKKRLVGRLAQTYDHG